MVAASRRLAPSPFARRIARLACRESGGIRLVRSALGDFSVDRNPGLPAMRNASVRQSVSPDQNGRRMSRLMRRLRASGYRARPAVAAMLVCLGTANGALAARAVPGRAELCPQLRDCPREESVDRKHDAAEPVRRAPWFNPSGTRIAFDAKDGGSGFRHVYISGLESRIPKQVTANGDDGFGRNSGNPVFSPSGRFLMFIAEESRLYLERVPGIGDQGVGLFSNLWISTGDACWAMYVPSANVRSQPYA